MMPTHHRIAAAVVLLVLGLWSVACSLTIPPAPVDDLAVVSPPELEALHDVPVPALPFDDNPDPSQCGIPVRWGLTDSAWLTGTYNGELVEPLVHLYDSHLRSQVTGLAPHGAQVQVILFQQNPTLDYYLVKTVDLDPPQEGWVPGPFLSFEMIEPAS